MRFAFYLRQPDNADHAALARAVVDGALAVGEVAYIFAKDTTNASHLRAQDCDALILFGIGGDAKQVWDAHAGKRRILLDKPYTRGGPSPNKPGRYQVVRVSVDSLHPTSYFRNTPRPPDRWLRFGLLVQPYDTSGGYILFDGASNKYCKWHGWDWHVWGEEIVKRIRLYSDLPILYRPRPSNNIPVPILGSRLSEGELYGDLRRARVVVSHGGNIGYDAVVAGRAHFSIGASVATSISEVEWRMVEVPTTPTEEERRQWLSDLAYCQWTQDEFKDGSAWRYLRGVLDGNGSC